MFKDILSHDLARGHCSIVHVLKLLSLDLARSSPHVLLSLVNRKIV